MPAALDLGVFIHGLDSRQTLVTIDGRRQSAGLSGADDNLTNLTLDNIDQIEVVRTPVSSAQGGSAMGGVINLVTLSGKGLATPEGSVSEEAGSFNTFRENAQSRGAVGNFDYAVSASRQDSIYPALSPGFPDFFAPGFPGQADQYRNTSYRGNFGYQVTPDIYLDLHSAYSNAYTSSPGIVLIPDPTASLCDRGLDPLARDRRQGHRLLHDEALLHARSAAQPTTIHSRPTLISFGASPQGASPARRSTPTRSTGRTISRSPRAGSITAGLQGDNPGCYESTTIGLGYDTTSTVTTTTSAAIFPASGSRCRA